MVTNLAPCSGVRLHLWPEKGKSTLNLPASKRVVEVTSKMVHIPSGPAPRQVLHSSLTIFFRGVFIFLYMLVFKLFTSSPVAVDYLVFFTREV